jgi:hypothetical protein
MSLERLAELAPLRTPPPVGWWPPAPLWWVLAALVLLALALLAQTARRRRRARAYRREALRQLKALYAAWEQSGDDLAYLRAASRLLKATALRAVPRADVAGLHGVSWAAWLARTAPTAPAPATAWAEALYADSAQQGTVDIRALQQFFCHWIRCHDQRRV